LHGTTGYRKKGEDEQEMKVAGIREDGSQKHIPALEHKNEMQRLPYLFVLGEVSTILRKMK
jgi:hypothetical protein